MSHLVCHCVSCSPNSNIALLKYFRLLLLTKSPSLSSPSLYLSVTNRPWLTILLEHTATPSLTFLLSCMFIRGQTRSFQTVITYNMNGSSPHSRQLLWPTGQRADLQSNEVPRPAALQHSTHLQSAISGLLGSDIRQGKIFAAVDPFKPFPSTDFGGSQTLSLWRILRELILKSTPEVSIQRQTLLKQLLIA